MQTNNEGLFLSFPKQIGPYAIEGVYAQGGMGVLFLATEPQSHDQIVVKVLLPKFLSDPSMVKQFLTEGKVIAMTNHPNIVKLYEYGEWEGGVFIAMELVKGVSLRKILQHSPLPLRRALEVLLQVCYAIEHLHSHGVVHGDLKPENILITDQNQVKVIDFGIAKVVSDSQNLLGHPSFIGTPFYMGPEAQQDPRKCTFQSDIFSLGIIAYELVLGKITHGKVILSLAPKGLQPILQKALQPRPEDRYKDINELIKDLSEYIHSGNLQKDKQGADYFFELFEQLESHQRTLLDALRPHNDTHLGITASYGVGLNALYFRCIEHGENTLALIAQGFRKGVSGILDTFCLHTLLPTLLEQHPNSSEAVEKTFTELSHHNIAFSYALLVITPSTKQFVWQENGWGKLFISSCTSTKHFKAEHARVIPGSYQSGDRFTIVGCTSPTILEFSATPVVPIDLVLADAIAASAQIPPQKQSDSVLHRLRLRGDCVLDDYPVCIVTLEV
jgi:serine/threonine protein kinase